MTKEETEFVEKVYKCFCPMYKPKGKLYSYEKLEMLEYFGNCVQTVRRLEATEMLFQALHNELNFRKDNCDSFLVKFWNCLFKRS